MAVKQNKIKQVSLLIFPVVLIVITPWYSFDSINIPKFTALVSYGFVGTFFIALNIKTVISQLSIISKFSVILFTLALLISFIFSETPVVQQIYGVEGRNHGILTMLSLYVIYIIYELFSEQLKFSTINHLLTYGSLIFICYLIVQTFGYDPVKWSTTNLVTHSTLGNPNYVSSFLGITFIPVFLTLRSKFFSQSLLLKASLFFTIFIIYIYLIYKTYSSQGFMVIFVSLFTYLLVLIWKFRSKIELIIISICGMILVLVLIAGAINRGVFSHLLYDGGTRSRGDFYRSALAIIADNPFTGVGADGFGDYYLQYRDQIAAGRPNAEFTTSAHNYFLDLASNLGLLALFVYVVLLLFVFFKFLRYLSKNNFNSFVVSLFTVWIGSNIQSLVSPNFFVFNILIFSISGLIVGRKSSSAFSESNIDSENKKNKFKLENLAISAGLVAASLVLVPMIQRDHALLLAYNGNSIKAVSDAVDKFPKSSISYSRTLKILMQNNISIEALDMARKAEKFNPRSYTPYFIYLVSPLTSPQEKSNAFDNLIKLDPNNLQLRNLKP